MTFAEGERSWLITMAKGRMILVLLFIHVIFVTSSLDYRNSNFLYIKCFITDQKLHFLDML